MAKKVTVTLVDDFDGEGPPMKPSNSVSTA